MVNGARIEPVLYEPGGEIVAMVARRHGRTLVGVYTYNSIFGLDRAPRHMTPGRARGIVARCLIDLNSEVDDRYTVSGVTPTQRVGGELVMQ